jgi:hypothetical protein
MKRLRSLIRLKSDNRNLLIYTFILLNLVRLGLWRLSFAQLQRYLDRISQTGRSLEIYRIQTLIWAVERSSRYSPGTVKCLARALTTQVLMRRQGYSSELRIGVAKNQQGVIQAHAWVVYQEHVIMGNLPDLDRYQPLTRRAAS